MRNFTTFDQYDAKIEHRLPGYDPVGLSPGSSRRMYPQGLRGMKITELLYVQPPIDFRNDVSLCIIFAFPRYGTKAQLSLDSAARQFVDSQFVAGTDVVRIRSSQV